MRNALAGCEKAWADLFRMHYHRVYAFAFRSGLSAEDAEDAAQEVFVKAARYLETFKGDSAFKNWLYGIAHHAVMDLLRKRGRREVLLERLHENDTTSKCSAAAKHTEVGDVLGQLPDDLRMAVVLIYYEGKTHKEASKIMDCAETTVSWRIYIAKKRLRKLLEKRG